MTSCIKFDIQIYLMILPLSFSWTSLYYFITTLLLLLVVSKMSFALPWQPPTDNISCIMFSKVMCIVYLLEIKLLLLLLWMWLSWFDNDNSIHINTDTFATKTVFVAKVSVFMWIELSLYHKCAATCQIWMWYSMMQQLTISRGDKADALMTFHLSVQNDVPMKDDCVMHE